MAIGNLHDPRMLPEEENSRRLLSPVYLGALEGVCHKSESKLGEVADTAEEGNIN